MDNEEIKIKEMWMSPNKAIERMKGIIEKSGVDIALTNDAYQQTRECWIAGSFLAIYSQITGKTYWLTSNPIKNAAPDITAVTFRDPVGPSEKGVVKEIQEIEICEYEEHSCTTITEHIKAKLLHKSYGINCILLCYLRKPGEEFVINSLINGLKNIKSDIREIWVIYQLQNDKPSHLTIARVYLRGDFQNTILIKDGDNVVPPQPDFVEVTRGTSKKVEFKHLGTIVFPVPKVKEKNKSIL